MTKVMKRTLTWDHDADIVVVGYGGAGASAAIESHDSGSAVIILEKEHLAGGTTAMSGGIIVGAGTSVQRARQISDSHEEMYKYFRSTGRGLEDLDMMNVLCEKSASNIEWLISMGTEFEVNYNGSQTTVNVISGEVEVSDVNRKKTVLVKTGQTTACPASGVPSEPVAYNPVNLNPWWLTMPEQPAQTTGKSQNILPWIALPVSAILLIALVANAVRLRRAKIRQERSSANLPRAMPIQTNPDVVPRYCKNCGAQLEEGSFFCIQCGTSVRKKAE